ncbi:hypothetical protein DFS34DRAFT_628017 [Phlyctochytrium arcticum]|nr:hypothetical protein DFS34DRAFT_628017 [Phlyctochytrium arcticum]
MMGVAQLRIDSKVKLPLIDSSNPAALVDVLAPLSTTSPKVPRRQQITSVSFCLPSTTSSSSNSLAAEEHPQLLTGNVSSDVLNGSASSIHASKVVGGRPGVVHLSYKAEGNNILSDTGRKSEDGRSWTTHSLDRPAGRPRARTASAVTTSQYLPSDRRRSPTGSLRRSLSGGSGKLKGKTQGAGSATSIFSTSPPRNTTTLVRKTSGAGDSPRRHRERSGDPISSQASEATAQRRSSKLPGLSMNDVGDLKRGYSGNDKGTKGGLWLQSSVNVSAKSRPTTAVADSSASESEIVRHGPPPTSNDFWRKNSAKNALKFLKTRSSNATLARLKSTLLRGSDDAEARPNEVDESEAVYDDLLLATARKLYQRRRPTPQLLDELDEEGDTFGERDSVYSNQFSSRDRRVSWVGQQKRESIIGRRLSRVVQNTVREDEDLTASQELHILFGEDFGKGVKDKTLDSNVELFGGEDLFFAAEQARESKEDADVFLAETVSRSAESADGSSEVVPEIVASDNNERVVNVHDGRGATQNEEAADDEPEVLEIDESPLGRFRDAVGAFVDGLRNTKAMVSGFNMTPSEDIIRMSKAIFASFARDAAAEGDGFKSFNVETFVPDEVRRALQKDPQDRTESDIATLQSHITRMRGFQRLPIKVQKELSRVIVLETREAGRIIYKQGHYPSSSYAVLTGCVALVRSLDLTPIDGDWFSTFFQHISDQRTGEIFGNREVKTDMPRSDTAICKERTELLRIDKWDYQEAVEGLASREEQEKIDLIESHAVFQTLQVGSTYLRRHTEVVTLPQNVTVFGPTEGDGHIFVLRSGTCRVVRNAHFIKTNLANGTYLLTHDNEWSAKGRQRRLEPNQERTTELLVVETLQPGAFFGEENLEVIRDETKSWDDAKRGHRKPHTPVTPSNNNRRKSMVLVARPTGRRMSTAPAPNFSGLNLPPQMQHLIQQQQEMERAAPSRTIITNDRCEILRMALDDFARIATEDTVSYLRNLAKSGPSEVDAAREYLRMREWGKVKRKVVKEIIGPKS